MARRNREDVKAALRKALHEEFPEDTVDVSDGFEDLIHVLVVSRRFDEMEEQAKQDLLWDLIDKAELNKRESALISLVLPVSPAEIK